MSDTQEKLRKIYNQIGEGFYWEGTYGDDDPQVEIDRQQFVDEIMQLIDSAKREGAIEELRNLPSERHETSGWCDTGFFIDSEDRWERIKQLEQTKEE